MLVLNQNFQELMKLKEKKNPEINMFCYSMEMKVNKFSKFLN